MASTPKAAREHPLRDMMVALRAKHGENSPSYYQIWTACADGRISSRKSRGVLWVTTTVAEIERMFGLSEPQKARRPKVPQRPSAA
jgi:hypothetical protein